MLQGLQALITAIEIVGSFLWVGLIYPEKDRGLVRRIGSAVGVVLATALTILQRNIAMYSRYYLIFCIILCTLICFLRFGIFCEQSGFCVGTAGYFENRQNYYISVCKMCCYGNAVFHVFFKGQICVFVIREIPVYYTDF